MRLAQLKGSHAAGTLQIAATAINDVLRLLSPGASAPTLELLPHNAVMVRYGMFHARAELPAVADAELPRVTLTLASLLVAWGLKALVRQPFLHVHGRHLTIDLSAIPAFSGWRDLWNNLHQLTFATAPGALHVGFSIAIDDARMD